MPPEDGASAWISDPDVKMSAVSEATGITRATRAEAQEDKNGLALDGARAMA